MSQEIISDSSTAATATVSCFICHVELPDQGKSSHNCDSTKRNVCPFSFIGCHQEFLPEDLMTHIQQNLMEHFQLACTSFVEMKTERDKLNLQVQELTDQNDKLQKHLREYMEEDDPVVTEIDDTEIVESLGDIHSYSSQLMEKLIDKRDGKAILYVLKNLESSEKTNLLMQYQNEIIEVAKHCVWIPDSSLDDIVSFTPSPTLSIQIFEFCPDLMNVCIACVNLAKSFTLPINCTETTLKISKWIQISEAIKDLLLFAKLRLSTFTNTQDYNIIGLCEDFLSHANIINEIVRTSKIDYEITFQDLMDTKKVRLIRDCLVSNTRFILANNISMKCRIETEGLHLLKKGNFLDARKKFDICLAPVSNQSNALNSRTTQPGLFPKIDSSRVLDSIISVLTENQEKVPTKNYEECVYYLFLFGNSKKIIDFFIKEERFDLAFKYIMENNIKPDVFVEWLLVPCEKLNKVDELKHVIQDFDSSIQKTKQYIFYGCNYFNKTQKYKSLTQWQILMKDYVRAGLTCIKVFLETKEENFKIQCLKIALSYFIEGHNNLINSSATSSLSNSSETAQLTNTTDISKYLARIKLQLQIFSQIKYDPIITYVGIAGPEIDNEEVVHYSLFGSKHQQAVLATYLMLDPRRIDLALQVIDNCKLEKVIIILKAAHYIVNVPLERFQDEKNNSENNGNNTNDLIMQKDVHLHQYILSVKSHLDNQSWDKMLNIIVKGIILLHKDENTAMKYVGLLTLPASLVEARVLCGHYMEAFNEAVKLNDKKLIALVRDACQKKKEVQVENLCIDYLNQHT